MQILKQAQKTSQQAVEDISQTVRDLLRDLESGREKKAEELARNFDKFDGDIVVSAEQIAAAEGQVSEKLKQDIREAHDNVRRFAEAQHQSMGNFQIEVQPGLIAGQKHIPMESAGCYVPGGRYSHIASAIMTVTTAKVAGVSHITACSPPKPGVGIPPAILYTLNLCGADTILNLGGVQGVAAMAFGMFGAKSADILVGPGNQFVAEAKRQLYGRVGIDMFAGPTDILIIADSTADPEIVAIDLVGQMEHGYNSPAWLLTTDEALARDVLARIPDLINDLPETNRINAQAAFDDYCQITLCDNEEELAAESDRFAPEHLQVHATNLEGWLDRLKNYGSLFLGEETTVAFGDKVSGPNHVLPTNGAAKYTGGLSVHKFVKTVTWQRMTQEANRQIGPACARISRLEGMEAHARTADARLAKYFPRQNFDLSATDE